MPRKIVELQARLVYAVALANAHGPSARAEVEESLDAAARLIDETRARVWLPQLHEARADVAGVWGDDATREAELREAQRQYIELDCPGRAERITRELASLGAEPSRTAGPVSHESKGGT